MASIQPVKSGYRVQVAVKGVRDSATFDTRAEAKAWGEKREKEIRENIKNPAKAYTFGKLLAKYAEEVSPTKRGTRWEQIRIEAMRRDPVADVQLEELSARHIAGWRDRRLKTVSGSTVCREMNILKHALKCQKGSFSALLPCALR